MNVEKVNIPTVEEVKKLLVIAKSHWGGSNTIAGLLGMKFLDLLIPEIEGEPDWNYYGLELFFKEHNIVQKDTLDDALSKLQ